MSRNEDNKSYPNQRASISSAVSATNSLSGARLLARTDSFSKSRSNSVSVPEDEQQQAMLEIPKAHENDALAQLKKGNALQRRASKRFSAYHMAKLANQSATEPMNSPPPKSIPLPNISADSSKTTEENFKAHSRISSTASVEYHPVDPVLKLKHESAQQDLIVIFLKVGEQVKRCLTSPHLNSNKLRLLFVEKFAYSPGGDVFPEIYIKEPKYDVLCEIEDSQLQDIEDGTLFQLKIPTPSTPSALLQMFSELKKSLLEEQSSAFQELKDMLHNKIQPNEMPKSSDSVTVVNPDHYEEVQAIKQEVSTLKQIQSSHKKTLQTTIDTILGQLQTFQSLSITTGKSANRDYMEKSQSKLSEVSDNLLSKVDDLQDLIEALRKDVAIRGARPPKKKIDIVAGELAAAKQDLEVMTDYIEVEKPNWKTIWESELDRVCEEQQFMTLQEDLVFDLKEDLNKAFETFDLVKMCCEQKEKAPKRNINNPILPIAKPGTYNLLRDQVLVEVQSVSPDHDGRLEAIRKAERLRAREKEYAESEAFEDELGNFVEKGNFKKAGCFEEIERQRRLKDEENLRVNYGLI